MTRRRAINRAGRSLRLVTRVGRCIAWAGVALFASAGVIETQAGAETPLNPPVIIHVDDTVHTLGIDMRDLVEAYVPVTVSTVTIAKSVPGYPEVTPATAGDVFLVPNLSTGTPQVSGSMLGGTPEQSTFGTFAQAAPPADLVLRLADGTPVAANHVGDSSGSLFAGTYYFEVPPTFTDATCQIDLGTIGPESFNDASGHTASALMGSIGPISIAVPAANAATNTSRPFFAPGGIAPHSFPWVTLALVIAAIALVAAAGYAIARSMRKRTLRDELIGTAPAPPPEHLRIHAGELIAYLAVTGAIARTGDDSSHTRHPAPGAGDTMATPIALPPVSTSGADDKREGTDEADQPDADEPVGPVVIGELPPGIARSTYTTVELEARTQALTTEVAEPARHPGAGELIDALVLGTVRVDGLVSEPSRAKTLEATVFLAVNCQRYYSAPELAAFIWEGREEAVIEATVHNYLGYVRQAVGPDRLSDGRTEGYRLVGPLDSDWRRFQALVSAALHSEPDQSVLLLTAALSLVRGTPFTRPKGVRSDAYAWAETSGLTHQIEFAIEQAAHRLATNRADTGDRDGARWAIAKGLTGARYSVVLCEDRLRIETDRAGLRRAFKAVKAILGKGSADLLPVYDEVARKIG